MNNSTATSVRAAAAERQRRRRARLRGDRLGGEQPQPRVVSCPWCERLWVPQRQGQFCSRSCVESAGRLRRQLKVDADGADDKTRLCLELEPRLAYLCQPRTRVHWTERLRRMRRLGLLNSEQDEQLRLIQPDWAQKEWPT